MASVKKNFLYNVLLVISNILFPVLVFPYIARTLGPTGLGEAQFALQFSKYFAIVASLGIPVYGMREVARVRHQKLKLNKLVSELLILHLLTALLSSGIYLAVVMFNDTLQGQQELFYIAGLQVLLGFLSIDWLFAGLEEFKIITIRSLVIRFITLAFLLIYVKQPGDVKPYLLISVLGIVGGHLWNLFYALARIRFIFRALAFTRHLVPIMLIFLMNLCISMYTIFDTAWVGFLSSPAAVGLYTSAMKLSKIAIPFVTTLGTVLIPRSARAFAADIKNPAHLYTSFNFIIDLAVPVSVGLFLLAPELLGLLSGHDFMGALPAMRILSFLPLLIGLSNLFGMQILSASGNDKAILLAVSGGMVVNVMLNLWLVPLYAHTGAAIAMCLTESFVTLFTFLLVYHKHRFIFSGMRFVRAVSVSLIFIPCIWWVKTLVKDEALLVVFSVLLCMGIYLVAQHILFKNEFISQGYELFKKRVAK